MKKMRSYLLIGILLVGFSLNAVAQKPGGNQSEAEASVRTVEKTMKLISEVNAGTKNITNANPKEGQRFIMSITGKTSIISSDEIGYPGSVVRSNVVVMQLTGKGSSNATDLTRAFLIFQDDDRAARPPYVRQDTDGKILFIWFPMSRVTAMQDSLARGNPAYVWIGNFGNSSENYVYLHADIHTEF